MKILVLQHVDVEHPGVFRTLWTEAGHEWVPVELDAGEPIPCFDGFDLMVSMGGPMDVWQESIHPWLVAEKAAIKHWVQELERPFLGICLGHQLLAEALGGKVGLMAHPEVGLSQVELTAAGLADPILAGFAAQVETFQWHGAEVVRPPERAEILAINAACPVQALRWGRHAYGFQYHCEIEACTVSDWESIPEYRASLEVALGATGAAKLGGRLLPKLADFRAAARRLNANLMAVVEGRAAARSV